MYAQLPVIRILVFSLHNISAFTYEVLNQTRREFIDLQKKCALFGDRKTKPLEFCHVEGPHRIRCFCRKSRICRYKTRNS